jgi:hypothetical protein
MLCMHKLATAHLPSRANAHQDCTHNAHLGVSAGCSCSLASFQEFGGSQVSKQGPMLLLLLLLTLLLLSMTAAVCQV